MRSSSARSILILALRVVIKCCDLEMDRMACATYASWVFNFFGFSIICCWLGGRGSEHMDILSLERRSL